MNEVAYACSSLPPLWSLSLDLEFGAATATLYDPDGSAVEFDEDSELTFTEQIIRLVEYARRRANDSAHRL